MSRSAAKFRVIEGDKVFDPREPEEMLSFLFGRQNLLRAELAAVERDLAEQRRLYGAKHKLLILPGYHTLRRLFWRHQ